MVYLASQSPWPSASVASGPRFLIRFPPPRTRDVPAPSHPLRLLQNLVPRFLFPAAALPSLGGIASPGNHAGLFPPQGPRQLTFLFLPRNCRVLQWFFCCLKVPVFALFLSDM